MPPPDTWGCKYLGSRGSGSVTLTHSGGTDVAVTSGTNYSVNGEYTLKFLPSGSNVVKTVILLRQKLPRKEK